MALEESRIGDDGSLELDELALRAQGHVSELPRQFSTMSLLAFAFSIMNSWIGFVSLLLTTLSMGGPTTSFWAPIVGCVASTIIAVGLAELASAFPSSGGQYHFAFMTAPKSYRAIIAYCTAWISILAYLFTTASGAIFLSESTVYLAQIYHPSFDVQRWHVWLVYAAAIISATAIVTFLPSTVPRTQSLFFWTSVLGIVSISITVLSTSDSKRPAKEIFASWDSSSGWNPGLTFMLAVGQGMWSFTCVDSATHVAEEIANPGKHVPRAMLLSLLIGVLTNIFFSASILFSCNNFEAVGASPVPMWEAFHQAMNNMQGATFFTIWVIFIYYGALVGLITTTGRLIWAFSRDNGMPFSKTLSHINTRLKVPVQANCLSAAFCILYGLLYVGSTVAFNTFISTAILFLNLSYTIPQAVVVLSSNDRDKILSSRIFRLPRPIGFFCNMFSLLWVGLYIVLFSFPLSLPVSSEGMNYVSVVLVAAFILIGCLWLGTGKRKTFTGPEIDFSIINAIDAGGPVPAELLHEMKDSK